MCHRWRIFPHGEVIFPTRAMNDASNTLKTHSRSRGALFALERKLYKLGAEVQMIGRGKIMAQESVQRIVDLLASTEMTVTEIAERMACSKSVVIAINRRFQVRAYNGLRTRWATVGRKAAS